ncbi:MAG TPA: 3D domain-containing protein [Oscillospiraceae bacterium]|nr:3D domain-containing protein [Oscillospiraceae bacterium]HXK78100.1 3D domain-containing protein [Oscillospiraceae bacterium]
MRKFLAGAFRFFAFFGSRYFQLMLFAAAASVLVFWIPAQIRTVRIDDDGEVFAVRTTEDNPERILEKYGITVGYGDTLSVTGFESSGLAADYSDVTAEIRVARAFEVDILADSLTYHLQIAGGTVADALYKVGIELRSTDLVDKPIQSLLSEGEYIRVTRVDYNTTTEEEPIPHGVSYRGTSLIREGRKVLLSYGRDGTKLLTYEQKTVDGVEEDRTLLSEDIIKRATDDLYLQGDNGPISDMDFGYEIVDNRPTQYEYLFSSARATGYYAKAGAGTATGIRAGVGYVAVDPSIIPYGTKLWICAHDGGSCFVYGYCIAADTGGAMLSGKNMVDLYYPTYYECVLNGLRYVDIYVLEWG